MKEKLETLKTASEQANEQLQKGEISQAQYDALRREIEETEPVPPKSGIPGIEDQRHPRQDRRGWRQVRSCGAEDHLGGKDTDHDCHCPVAALGAAAVTTAANFDEGMSKVAAISGATGKDLDDLRGKGP